MARAIILSASTGNGHNQAAKSLKNELEFNGYEVKVMEPFKEENRLLETIVDDGYNLLATKMPKVYGRIYKITAYKYVNKCVVLFINRTLSNTICEIVNDYQPDLIITTHPLFVSVVSTLKATGRISIPLISIVTDYTAHRFYINKFVDAYIVGSSYTKESLIAKGIPEQKIFSYGIPVKKEFRFPVGTKKDNKFTLLIMGGSMGISYIKKCLKKLLFNTNDLRIIVVCGNNKRLYRELLSKYSGYSAGKEIILYGYTRNVHELMGQSDLIVTKPGGLTVTEALTKGIPMIIPFFIPGQEEENTDILTKAGVAVRVKDAADLNVIVNSFIDNPILLEKMRKCAQDISKDYSTENIICLADNLVKNYHNHMSMVQ